MLVIFASLLSRVLGVFNSLVAIVRHMAEVQVFHYNFVSENASLLCMFVPPPTGPLR